MRKPLPIKVLALIAGAALLLAACVDEGEDGAAPAPLPTQEAETQSPEGEASGAGEEGQSSSGGAGEADEAEDVGVGDPEAGQHAGDPDTPDVEAGSEEVPAVPLTASDRGVSETRILIGIPLIDVEQLQAFGVIDPDAEVDERAAWEFAIAYVNDRGGINGRMLDAAYAVYLPLGVVESDIACVELVEDNEVFAAVARLVVAEGVLCYTELNGTPFFGRGPLTDEVRSRSAEVAVATEATLEDIQLAMIDFAASEGALDRPVAVHGDNRNSIERTVDVLESRGADVVSISIVSAREDDVQARVAEFEGIFERWRSDGAEAVINVGTTLDILSAMGRQEFYIDVYSAETGVFLYQADEEREYEALRHVTTVAGTTGIDEAHGPTAACREAWDSRNPDMPFEDFPSQAEAVYVSCTAIELFAAVATRAGPNLTHESLAEALSETIVLDLPGAGEVRIGGDGPNGQSRIPIFRFDEETRLVVETGSVPLQ